jgi:hypothetical protein
MTHLQIFSTLGMFASMSVPTEIEWERLSEAGLWSMSYLVLPLAIGYKERDVARMHGKPLRWVTERLDALRGELERQALPR